jgi:hypothetical protein
VILAIHPEIEGAHWRLFYCELFGEVTVREFQAMEIAIAPPDQE